MKSKSVDRFIGALCFAVLAISTASNLGATESAGRGSENGLYEVRKSPLSFTLHLSGEVESSAQSLVRAETGGVVGAIHVIEGQLVKKGDLLCEITSRRKRSDWEKAIHNAEIAKLEWEKAKSEQSTAENKEAAAWQVKIASEKYSVAEIERNDLAADVERLAVKAPFSGKVVSIDVKIGDFVSGSGSFSVGSAILQLVPDSEFAINTNVGEHELMNIEQGKDVRVIIPALNDRSFPARVTRLAQVGVQTNTRARVFPLTVVFAAGDASVRLGMTGRIDVPIIRKSDVIMIPIQAVHTDSSGSYVNVSLDGRNERRMVSLGLATASDVEVVSGVAEGEKLLVLR